MMIDNLPSIRLNKSHPRMQRTRFPAWAPVYGTQSQQGWGRETFLMSCLVHFRSNRRKDLSMSSCNQLLAHPWTHLDGM